MAYAHVFNSDNQPLPVDLSEKLDHSLTNSAMSCHEDQLEAMESQGAGSTMESDHLTVQLRRELLMLRLKAKSKKMTNQTLQ